MTRPLAIGVVWALAAAIACTNSETPAQSGHSEPSPNVTITPAPLLSGESLVTKLDEAPSNAPGEDSVIADHAEESKRTPASPKPFPVHEAPQADVRLNRIGTALTLQAHLEWPGREGRLRLTGLSEPKAAELNQQLGLQVIVELRAIGRMRLRLLSRAFSISDGSSILSRRDALGHLLVWPREDAYRVLSNGSLRALFAEGRVDITPLSRGDLLKQEDGERLGYVTRRIRVTTARGSLRLEQTRLETTSHGGPLLCRFLLELISMQGVNEACRADMVPLWAELKGSDGETLRFVVDSLVRRGDAVAPVFVPPRKARFRKRGLPNNHGVLLHANALSALSPVSRIGSLDVDNRTSLGSYMVLSGARLAFIPPHERMRIRGLPETEFPFAFRGFFGEELAPERPTLVPGFIRLGRLSEDEDDEPAP